MRKKRHLTSTGETVFLGKVEQKGVRIIESMVDEGAQPALHISALRGTRVHLLAAATAMPRFEKLAAKDRLRVVLASGGKVLVTND